MGQRIELELWLKDHVSNPLRSIGGLSRKEFGGIASDVKLVEKELGRLANRTNGIGTSFRNIAGIIGGAGVIYTLSNIAKEAANVTMDFEKMATSFEVLTGGAKSGKELVYQLRELKQHSFMGADVYKNAQTMLGFGIGKDEIIKDLKAIGDIAMGDQERMQSLTLAFSQMRATGRLQGQDLMQFVNAGFNPLSVMSDRWKEFGFTSKRSIGNLKQLMEKGGISSDMVTKAIDLDTGEGGRFFNMTNKLMGTAAGKIAGLKGAWASTQIALGGGISKAMGELADLGTLVLHTIDLGTKLPDSLRGERLEIEALTKSIVTLNGGNVTRKALLEDLKDKYPEWYSKLDTEKAKNADLLDILQKVNAEYKNRIDLATRSVRGELAKNESNELYDLAKKVRLQAEFKKMRGGMESGLGILNPDNFKYLGAADRIRADRLHPFSEGIKDMQEWATWAEKEAARLSGVFKKEQDYLKNATKPLPGATGKGDSEKNHSQLFSAIQANMTPSASAITGGGKRSIVININKPAVEHQVIQVSSMGEAMEASLSAFQQMYLKTIQSTLRLV